MSELPEILDAIVVGAGWAGLTCARSLQAAGWNVRILEKSRGWGGRAARRRLLPEGMASMVYRH
nr:FAD-dependent oxidoreductase [Synechococcus elongatus]